VYLPDREQDRSPQEPQTQPPQEQDAPFSSSSSSSTNSTFELEGLFLLDHALTQFEQMVEQHQRSSTSNPEPDDGLARELQELERSEKSLRRELQVFDSTSSTSLDADREADVVDVPGDAARQAAMADKVRAASHSLLTGQFGSTTHQLQQQQQQQKQEDQPSSDHPDIAAGPPPPPPPFQVENPFDGVLSSPADAQVPKNDKTSASNEPEESLSPRSLEFDPQPETISEVGTDVSMNTVAFLTKSPPSARQRVPSDGDEQLIQESKERTTDETKYDDDDDALATSNRGLPLQFDPDTYSYDAEVDAILNPHTQELQDIDEGRNSAAYTTTSDDDDSMAGNSGAMRVAPPYLDPPVRRGDASSSTEHDLLPASRSITSDLSSSGSGSDVRNSTTDDSAVNTSSSSGSSSDSSSSERRRLLAGAVISPAVAALALAQGSSANDGAVVYLDDGNGKNHNEEEASLHSSDTQNAVMSSSDDGKEEDGKEEEEPDAQSVSILAAAATPLVLPRTTEDSTIENYDGDGKKAASSSSVHSFSVGTASDEESNFPDFSMVVDGRSAHLMADQDGDAEVPTSANYNNNLSRSCDDGSERRNKRKERGLLRGISWSDRIKLVIAVLFWAGMVAMVYFLIAWATEDDDNSDGDIDRKSPEGEVEGPPTAAPAVAPVPVSPVATAAPTTLSEAVFNLLTSSSFDDGAALGNPDSPQYQAFEWLIGNSNLTEYSVTKTLTRYALATFYLSTGGNESWSDDTLWLSDADECDWFSRSRDRPCNFQGGFQDLQVSYNNLAGVLPPELGLLSNSLVTINIGGGPNNAIGGSVPTELGYLSNLQELRLPNNDLSGSLPTEIGQWSNIRTIDLSGNRLEGVIPEEIGAMTDLFSLAVGNNALSGPIPVTLGNLVGLKTLTLSSNRLTVLPGAIGDLRDLVFLEMQENAFEGSLTTRIGLLGGLRRLKLHNNTFDQQMPSELALMSGLTMLDLSFNSFTGPLPPFGMVASNQMRNLRLSHNLLTGVVPDSFANLTGLQELLLEGNDLSGVMPEIVCDSFENTFPTVSVDCNELECPCCNFCCVNGEDCFCQFANTTDAWQCV